MILSTFVWQATSYSCFFLYNLISKQHNKEDESILEGIFSDFREVFKY